MQEITVNELIMTPPADYKLNLNDLLSRVNRCFSKLFTITSDIDIYMDIDSISLHFEGVNEKASVITTDEWIGDPDCCYGETKRTCLESENFIETEDIKMSIKKEFPGWDIDLSDVYCQSKEDVYKEECA